MKRFQTIEETTAYVTAEEQTNTDPRHLVTGSQNVLIDKNRKVSIRKGFARLGAADTTLAPIRNGLTWQSSSGTELPIRVYDDELEVYLGTVDSTDLNAWYRIADGWNTSTIPRFAPWFNDGESIDELLFVWGDDNLYRWNGAVAIVSSIAATTVTKTGTSTFAQNRFYTTGNKTFVCVRTGTEYTYTGGEDTTTLTGIADTAGLQAGDVLVQKIITNTDTPVADRNNHTIFVFENQALVGSNDDQNVYISANDDPTDFTYSSPRVAGEGALLTLDGTSKGFGTLGNLLVIFAGKDSIFRAEYTEIAVSTTLAETLKVKKLQSGVNQGAQNPETIVQVNDAIVYLSHEPAWRYIETPSEFGGINPKTLSNPIKPDFDNETWTNACALFYRNATYLSAPSSGKVYILEFSEDADGKLRRFWQPPQLLPVRAFSVINEKLHGHSNAVPETYELFTGYSDINSADEKLPITAQANWAYRNYGDRANLKEFDEYFIEGEITPSTELEIVIYYDYGGTTWKVTKTIDGADADITEETILMASLGQQPLAQQSNGGANEAPPEAQKFRVIFEIPKETFHEIQPRFMTDGADKYWAILSHGPNAQISPRRNTIIRK